MRDLIMRVLKVTKSVEVISSVSWRIQLFNVSVVKKSNAWTHTNPSNRQWSHNACYKGTVAQCKTECAGVHYETPVSACICCVAPFLLSTSFTSCRIFSGCCETCLAKNAANVDACVATDAYGAEYTLRIRSSQRALALLGLIRLVGCR